MENYLCFYILVDYRKKIVKLSDLKTVQDLSNLFYFSLLAQISSESLT